MAAIFSDLDGSFLKWGTERPLTGALEELLRFQAAGHQIVFTTQRQQFDPDFDMEGLRALLSRHFPECFILYGITSPRIVLNDAGAIAINHPRDYPWTYDLVELAKEKE